MKKATANDIIDNALIELYLNSKIEDVISLSNNDNHDLSLTHSRRQQLSKRLKFQAVSKLNNIKNQKLLAKAEKIKSEIVNQYVDKPFSELKRLLMRKGLNVQFRNLDKLDEDGIRSFLDDLDFLEIVEKLDD